MIFREAILADIPQIQIVRNSVTQNALSNPALVSDRGCAEFMFERGKGWVCEIDGQIVGFAIADLQDENIWALFVHPDFENRRIGRTLHNTMLNWYFSQHKNYVWLSTAIGTRAEIFYAKSGWTRNGMHGNEAKFEMTAADWNKISKSAFPE